MTVTAECPRCGGRAQIRSDGGLAGHRVPVAGARYSERPSCTNGLSESHHEFEPGPESNPVYGWPLCSRCGLAPGAPWHDTEWVTLLRPSYETLTRIICPYCDQPGPAAVGGKRAARAAAADGGWDPHRGCSSCAGIHFPEARELSP